MLWIMIMVVVIAGTAGESYKAYLKHQAKTLELRENIIREERLLEEAKHKTLVMENERLRLELDTDVAKYERQKERINLEKR